MGSAAERLRPTSPMTRVNVGVDIFLKREREVGSHGSHKEWATPAVIAYLCCIHGLGKSRRRLLLSSSGNTAIAVAAQTADMDIELFVVADVLSAQLLLDKLRRFSHVRLIVVNDPDASGSHMAARRKVLADLAETFGADAVELDQYGASAFPLAYASTLAAEIEAEVPDLAAIFVPVGTCGTALGLETYRRQRARRWVVVPVDVPGSRLFPQGSKHPGRRVFAGIGNGIRTAFAEALPNTLQPRYVGPVEIARTCRFLSERLDIWLGPSSGAAIAAFLQAVEANEVPHWGRCVAVCPDAADAYRDTLYSDGWLLDHGLGRALLDS